MHGRIARLLVLVGLVVAGCSVPSSELDDRSLDPGLAGQDGDMSQLSTRRAQRATIGQSVKGKPIEMFTFPGDADRAVLVIGGIHGNEPTSVDVAASLVELLEAQPELASGRLVAVIVNANPDGYASKRRTNARGIDINRNFDASNFKQARRGIYAGGVVPLSEPESQAIASVITRLSPRLLISVHSIERGKHCNNYDGPAGHIAEVMSARNGYPSKDTIGYPTPGSLGSWAGQDLQIPMITLELPRDVKSTQAWRDNCEAIVAAIAMRP
jgi:protein MpaA